MSLIITRNFRRAKAQDAAAKDKAPDGWWEGKTIFAAFGWGKSVKGKVVSHKNGVIKLADGTTFKESDAYDLYAIDSVARDADELNNDACDAMDANFKVGDTVRVDASYSRNVNNGIGKVVKVDGSSDIVVEFAGHGTVRVPVSYATLVNSRAADACDAATTSKFKPNDLVEWRDAHGRHNSAFYVRDNGDRITVSIEKNGHGGGLEIPKAWITNSRAADRGQQDDN